jgi:hypothetical protein
MLNVRPGIGGGVAFASSPCERHVSFEFLSLRIILKFQDPLEPVERSD